MIEIQLKFLYLTEKYFLCFKLIFYVKVVWIWAIHSSFVKVSYWTLKSFFCISGVEVYLTWLFFKILCIFTCFHFYFQEVHSSVKIIAPKNKILFSDIKYSTYSDTHLAVRKIEGLLRKISWLANFRRITRHLAESATAKNKKTRY